VTTRTQQIETGDAAFGAHVALPAAGSGPGIVLIHEIFGVNDYIRASAPRLAALGYVVLAPDFFWRTQPGLELPNDDAGMKAGMAAAQQLDSAAAVGDAITAMGALRALPEVTDHRAGVLGFCLGGSLAYRVAVEGDPDVAVVYYGSAVPGALEEHLVERRRARRAGHDRAAGRGRSPGPDAAVDRSLRAPAEPAVPHHPQHQAAFIPRELVDAVAAMAEGHDNIECHVHEGAGHAFDNHCSERFFVREASAAAWELTAAFLARELPT